ncbi:MAG TPA: TIM-barrel domain-containing protein [Terriglobales bacterium]|jgi:alpha-glucosidase (family GH31 glycosyl hydrolase)|nr:TIM-barrel domain-containing protein [Terriglobales bacterium]
MSPSFNRRQAVKSMIAASVATAIPKAMLGGGKSPDPGSHPLEVQITSISPHTLRLQLLPVRGDRITQVSADGSLVREDWGPPLARIRDAKVPVVECGILTVRISDNPLTISIARAKGGLVQRIQVDRQTGALAFSVGDSPLLGLGEGGPQFDRRGSLDRMKSGQGGYELATHGGRVPIPWLISTGGWAMFIHQPYGSLDLTGSEGKFYPFVTDQAFPADIFLVASEEPPVIMEEYARLTGRPELPPLWSLGYQQSHRTLASRDEVLSEAKTFREKKLPCDALIYLGTGFCPSGWNTENGSFTWNDKVFPDPREIIQRLHEDHFKVVLHSVIETDTLRGRAQDKNSCPQDTTKSPEANCYWDAHRPDFSMGVDGWWPDEGDPLDVASRLVRNRLYWEGPQIDRPNERPYALHRNGYAGMQRYASFLWSGDVYSTWETLKTQVPIAVNTSLTGIPYWGTDIGGFVPTREFTAELYLRWFQFGAFCTLFRCHGRNWKLRLPWGWNTGDPGPIEIKNYDGAAIPDASQLHNPQIEQVCRKYLNLRYRMLPYIYSAVREATQTGMPVMRALWLHYPDDPRAVACGDQYLWGRDVLVAPVVEQGANLRKVYLPRGTWYDFWTNERIEGGREISRAVDLETIPLYLRAGAIVPLGPVKQFVGEESEEPLTVTVYPGSDGSFLLYEDDGKSFDFRRGEWMGVLLSWQDHTRTLRMQLAPGSKLLGPSKRRIQVRAGENLQQVEFDGSLTQIRF